jgi:hypothetical protein
MQVTKQANMLRKIRKLVSLFGAGPNNYGDRQPE